MGHTHDNGHGHTHDHSHASDGAHGAMNKKEEFTIRITRWRDHNAEHQKSLEEWGVVVEKAGFKETAAAMQRAAEALANSVGELDTALRALK